MKLVMMPLRTSVFSSTSLMGCFLCSAGIQRDEDGRGSEDKTELYRIGSTKLGVTIRQAP
jgi:hypothetical protein